MGRRWDAIVLITIRNGNAMRASINGKGQTKIKRPTEQEYSKHGPAPKPEDHAGEKYLHSGITKILVFSPQPKPIDENPQDNQSETTLLSLIGVCSRSFRFR